MEKIDKMDKIEKGGEATGGRWGTKAVAAQKEKAAKKALLKRQFSKNNLPTHIVKLTSQSLDSNSDSDDLNVNSTGQKKRKNSLPRKKVIFFFQLLFILFILLFFIYFILIFRFLLLFHFIYFRNERFLKFL